MDRKSTDHIRVIESPQWLKSTNIKTKLNLLMNENDGDNDDDDATMMLIMMMAMMMIK